MMQESSAFALVAEDFVSPEQVDDLKAFIEECPMPEVPPDVLTEEYWVSVETAQQPRNPVEALIARLLRRPDLAATVGDVAGVEWSWHDYLDTDDPKVYHTDCNRRLVDCKTVRTNPCWSSVVYLTNEGGPTVVWRGDEFAVVQPRRGRYFIFQGDLPHGVLHTQEPQDKDRIVLSITFWRNGDDATGSRERPTGELASLQSRENDSSKVERGPNTSEQPLTALVTTPVSVPFSDHIEEWLAQRLPADLRVARNGGQMPAHVAVRYVDADYDADWCPLVSHALG